jgi:AbrB family looped-hinge helix DNA binding protein
MSIKMRVTTNGRVTIPKEIRDKLGFVPGTDLDFVVQGDEISLTKTNRKTDKLSRGEEIVARIAGSGTANLDLTTDEIMALMRG